MKTEVWSPAKIAEAQRDSTRIAPGMWRDRHGALHFSVPELIAVFGWPDDAYHRGLVIHAVDAFVGEHFPGVTITQTEPES